MLKLRWARNLSSLGEIFFDAVNASKSALQHLKVSEGTNLDKTVYALSGQVGPRSLKVGTILDETVYDSSGQVCHKSPCFMDTG